MKEKGVKFGVYENMLDPFVQLPGKTLTEIQGLFLALGYTHASDGASRM